MNNLKTMTLQEVTKYLASLPATLEGVDLTEVFGIENPSSEDLVRAQTIVEGWSDFEAALISISKFADNLEWVSHTTKQGSMKLH